MKAWLHGAYLDLRTPATSDFLTPFGVELAWRALSERREVPRFQSVGFASLRRRLRAETGEAIAIEHPGEAAPERRSERWSELCAQVASADALGDADFERLCFLLGRLFFHRLVHGLAARRDLADCDAETASRIRYADALACYLCQRERTGTFDTRPFIEVIERSARGTTGRVHATYQLAVNEAKGRKRIDVLADLLDRHEEEVLAASRTSRFEGEWLQSRLHRVGAFLPQLAGRFEEMTAAMDEAEAIARGLPAPDEEYALARSELIWPVLESRIKEAYAVGDLDRAEASARRLVEMTPMQARAQLHLGTVLLDRERLEEAALAFRRAARYGPPGTEMALFYVGQCAEAEGDIEAAADAYLEVLRLDPLSDAALDALSALPVALPDGWRDTIASGQARAASA